MSDYINRQDAIDAIEAKEANEFGNYMEYNVAFNDGLRSAVFALEELPSAELPIKDKCAFCPHCKNCDVNDDLTIQPTADVAERKTGEWILQEDKTKKHYGWHFCSECGAWIGEPTNFCSECGADMRGDSNDN